MPRKKTSKAKNGKSIKEIQTELEANAKEQKKLSQEKEELLNKKVFTNIIIAIVVMLYLFLINMGSLNIETVTFVKDLKVFSIMLIILTIALFEYSYKKDSGTICINGIETLVLAIITLFSPYIYMLLSRKFNLIVATASFLFGAYYVAKAIIIYKKGKKKYLKEANDISEIIN